jgi:hypothetical protein
LRGAWEAIYQGTPVIVSDWPLLRDAFDEGAVHADNTASGIAAAVARARDQYGELSEGARRLRSRKEQRWTITRSALLDRLGVSRLTPQPS